jgi:hypothetical protein
MSSTTAKPRKRGRKWQLVGATLNLNHKSRRVSPSTDYWPTVNLTIHKSEIYCLKSGIISINWNCFYLFSSNLFPW